MSKIRRRVTKAVVAADFEAYYWQQGDNGKWEMKASKVPEKSDVFRKTLTICFGKRLSQLVLKLIIGNRAIMGSGK